MFPKVQAHLITQIEKYQQFRRQAKLVTTPSAANNIYVRSSIIKKKVNSFIFLAQSK
jgi:hypothetical protein